MSMQETAPQMLDHGLNRLQSDLEDAVRHLNVV